MQSKKSSASAKNIFHFIIIIFMLLAIFFGIVFSSLKINGDLALGSQYHGSYQAVVGVYDKSQTNEEDKSLPNGDSNIGADILQAKMSPFANGDITITIDGRSRLIVTAPRDSYNNNKQNFINAIQSTGGLFVLDDKYQDVMLSTDLMTKAGLSGDIKSKSPTSDLLGKVTAVSEKANDTTNKPFVRFELVKDHFKNMVATSKDDKQGPTLAFVVDIPTLLDTIRNYFLFSDTTNEDELNSYLDAFLNIFLKPLWTKMASDKDGEKLSDDSKAILKDFWSISYYSKAFETGQWNAKDTVSLADKEAIKKIKIANDIDSPNKNKAIKALKNLLFPDNSDGKVVLDQSHQFSYDNAITKYIYDSNATADDFKEGGAYSQLINVADNKSVKVNQAFNALTNVMIPTVATDGIVNADLNKALFDKYFLFDGQVAGASTNSLNQDFGSKLSFYQPGFTDSHEYQASIKGDGLLIATQTTTYAKESAALIGQTGSGITFHVFSAILRDPILNNLMFVFSLVVLGIIAVIIAIFLLFFYRLFGFFTIILAAIMASMTLLMNVVFGIAMGPDILAVMFVAIGLTMDLSVVLFEAFKNNVYRDKRPLASAFRISNRETLGLVIDVSLIALIPPIILFWLGIGFLKNYATILALSIFFTLIFGIVVLRILMYLSVKIKRWHAVDWLWPIDTSLDYRGSFFKNYQIEWTENQVAKYSNRTNLSAQDLIKIKRLEERIVRLRNQNEAIIQKREAKALKRQEAKMAHYQKRLSVYEERRSNLQDSSSSWSRFRLNHNKRQSNRYRLALGTVAIATPNENEIGVEAKNNSTALTLVDNRLAKVGKQVGKIGWLTIIIGLIFGAIATGLGTTIGLNYSPNYGRGTQYYIYGSYVTQTYDTLAAANTIPGLNDVAEGAKIAEDLEHVRAEATAEVLAKHQGEDDSKNPDLKTQIFNEYSALAVARAYQYMISHDYMTYLNTQVRNVNFRDMVISYGPDYMVRDDTSTGRFANLPWVSITLTNDLISHNDAIKKAFQAFAGYGIVGKPREPKNDGGILGMRLNPHTVDNQIKQIAITFGIVLLALLIYMMIRFKWTYYVALALGLVIIMGISIAIMIAVQIPFSVEALAGILGALEFALISGVLILGKGKSLIVSRNEKTLARYFEDEIRLQVAKKEAKQTYRQQLADLKGKHRAAIKALDDKAEDYKTQRKDLLKANKIAYKAQYREWKSIYHQSIEHLNYDLREEAQKNNFLKEIFNEVLRFGIFRTIFIGLFYLAAALVLTITLPPIAVMGFMLLIGVIVTTLVTLTIMLPLWLRFEGRRIRWKYGYKRFVNKLHVNREEQVVPGLND